MLQRKKTGTCPLCLRKVKLTFHHLVPKKLHRRNFYRKNYSREQLNEGINICRNCHSGIHDIYDEMTLARYFNTLEALQHDASLTKHFAWAAKQKVQD
ncbi:MAG: hypothetical protein PVJ63_10835 [Thioalkalispiraceae bacterium]|jgi:5-methylcytosine-specific restriction endonuclease McrA